MTLKKELAFKGDSYEICFLARNDRCESKDFLNKARIENKAAFIAIIAVLERFAERGAPNNENQFRRVRQNIYEIKVKSFRIFGFFENSGSFILTNGCKKGVEDVQTRAIQKSESLKNLYKDQNRQKEE